MVGVDRQQRIDLGICQRRESFFGRIEPNPFSLQAKRKPT
jgi:hypothetical protein